MEGSQQSQVLHARSSVIYAGLWLRLAASLVDSLTMFIPLCIVAFVVVVIVRLVSAAAGYEPAVLILIVLPPVAIITTLIYFVMMESSSWQATLRKKLIGLYVTDTEGQRLSLSRGTNLCEVTF
jgi:uncharacterized RDD family membrane protein YckC